MLKEAKASIPYLGLQHTIFHNAISQGCVQTIEFMLKSKMKQPHEVFTISMPSHSGAYIQKYVTAYTTPLIFALRHRRFEVALFLMSNYKNEVIKTINSPYEIEISEVSLISDPSVPKQRILLRGTRGTALSHAIEGCHLETVLKLRDLGAEVPAECCFDSLQKVLSTPDISDQVKKPFIQLFMNFGKIKINNTNLSSRDIEQLKVILDSHHKDGKEPEKSVALRRGR